MSKQNPFQLTDLDLQLIRAKVAEKRKLAKGREVENFAVFDRVVNCQELVALEFLYAFMPLVDLADYSGELFLKHVRHSLETRKKMPWGEKISGELFLHFVLPYRITNETIEDYRPYFFNELYDRVKDLTMEQAILEINHWCHEKATYIGADPRTISPLNLVKTARGRCGEESALLVCALRSLGIPARQVYTSRWAHTDSNHAWVEAWADGEWFFLGACEPESKLNSGWFVGPAKRAMFIHTKVPGCIYSGPEEQVQVQADYTELNLLENYAPTKYLTVLIKDQQGLPAKDVSVEFQVFNYGGFASLADLTTDDKGQVGLTVGQGDLLIHASSQEYWKTLFVATACDSAQLTLDENVEEYWELTVIPPQEILEEVQTDSVQDEKTKLRIEQGENLRLAYEASFPQKEDALRLGATLGLDGNKIWEVLERSRGNSGEIISFLEAGVSEYGELALDFLLSLAPKDLCDTKANVLIDHLANASIFEGLYSQTDFIEYIMQPRISWEPLRAYRHFFQTEFTLDRQDGFRHNPLELKAWIQRNIRQVPHEMVRGWPTPQGVYELKAGSELAQEILFVAMARSFGIPARLVPIDGRCQYLHEEHWISLDFSTTQPPRKSGILQLHKGDLTGNLEYYQNFSLARLVGQKFQTLRFTGLDEEAFNDLEFKTPLEVEPGLYRLTTGQREADGRGKILMRTLLLEEGQTLDLPVLFQGELNQKNLGKLPQEVSSSISANGKGVVMVWLDSREPSKHLLRDLKGRKEQFEATGAPVLLFTCGKLKKSLDLPATVEFNCDQDDEKLDLVLGSINRPIPRELPLVLVVDPQGIIRFVSAGYQVGTGAQILAYLED